MFSKLGTIISGFVTNTSFNFITTVGDNYEQISNLESEEITENLIERLKNITRAVDKFSEFGLDVDNKKTTSTTSTAVLSVNTTHSIIDGLNTIVTPQLKTPSNQTYPSKKPASYCDGGFTENVTKLQLTTTLAPSIKPIPQQTKFLEQRQQQPPLVHGKGRFNNKTGVMKTRNNLLHFQSICYCFQFRKLEMSKFKFDNVPSFQTSK